jgi:predicted phage-related endonuclease
MTQADLAVLIAGDEFRIYSLRADTEFQDHLFELADRFWIDCILPKKPPAPDFSERYAEYLSARFPSEARDVLFAPPEAEKWARQLHHARAEMDIAERLETEAKNNLKAICGQASGLQGDGWKVSWRQSKGRVSTDWEAIASELNAPPHLIARHTAEKPGPRVFRPTFTGDKS